jgi:hypothetical protein
MVLSPPDWLCHAQYGPLGEIRCENSISGALFARFLCHNVHNEVFVMPSV